MTKHVLWPKSVPRPDTNAYAAWYKSSDVDWVSEDELPNVASDAKVQLFFLTKPVFGLIGRATSIWHGGLGFRVENGPSFVFEYTSLKFMAAVAYPDKNGTNDLGWPCTAIVDYMYDASGKTFPVTGAKWKETVAIGTTTGAGLNSFASWAFQYSRTHARYLVWRALENGTERTLVDSAQCFDFVWDGLRFLHSGGKTRITVTELPRTIVNVYVSAIEAVPLNASIANFFSSERRVLEEWLELTDEFSVFFRRHSKEWYWPAWFSPTTYAGGTGKLLQDTDIPDIYHRYVLQWPQKFQSKSTTQGLLRLNVPIFNPSNVTVLV